MFGVYQIIFFLRVFFGCGDFIYSPGCKNRSREVGDQRNSSYRPMGSMVLVSAEMKVRFELNSCHSLHLNTLQWPIVYLTRGLCDEESCCWYKYIFDCKTDILPHRFPVWTMYRCMIWCDHVAECSIELHYNYKWTSYEIWIQSVNKLTCIWVIWHIICFKTK
jgi:hypothetical protein